MTIGGVSSALPVADSSAETNNVQLVAAISMQKRSQDLLAEQTRVLIASATGGDVGSKVDVRG